jgi:hypothetical protein
LVFVEVDRDWGKLKSLKEKQRRTTDAPNFITPFTNCQQNGQNYDVSLKFEQKNIWCFFYGSWNQTMVVFFSVRSNRVLYWLLISDRFRCTHILTVGNRFNWHLKHMYIARRHNVIVSTIAMTERARAATDARRGEQTSVLCALHALKWLTCTFDNPYTYYVRAMVWCFDVTAKINALLR